MTPCLMAQMMRWILAPKKMKEEDEVNASVENDEEDVVLEEGEEGEEEDVEEDEAEDDHDIDNDDEDDDIDGDDVDGDLEGDDVDGDDLGGDDLGGDNDGDDDNTNNDDDTDEERESKAQKRKFLDYVGQLNAADTSLRTLKKLAGTKMEVVPSDTADGILSNEDFQRIKELKAKKEAKLALVQQGLVKKGADPKAATFKIPSSEQLSSKRVDPAILEVNIRRKHSKEERLALIRAGRDDRGEYRSRAFVKQKKTGGLSNRQKEHKKLMPMAAKRQKVARSRQEKKKRDGRSGKQFRGKKAWK